MERKSAHSSLKSDSASSQMVMDELDKFENVSNGSGKLSSDSSDLFQLKMIKTTGTTHHNLINKKSDRDFRLPSTRQMQQQLAELQT